MRRSYLDEVQQHRQRAPIQVTVQDLAHRVNRFDLPATAVGSCAACGHSPPTALLIISFIFSISSEGRARSVTHTMPTASTPCLSPRAANTLYTTPSAETSTVKATATA